MIRKKFAAAIMLVLVSADFARARNSVENVVVTEAEGGGSALVVFETEDKISYSIQEIAFPPQIQIDVFDDVDCGNEVLKKVDKKLVQGIKFVCRDLSGSAQPKPKLKSIHVLLNAACTATPSQNDWILSIALKRKTEIAPVAERTQPSVIAEPPQEVPMLQPPDRGYTDYAYSDDLDRPRMSLSNRPSSEEVLRVGMANHRPLQIAEHELSLARRRLFEARRNYFPVLSGRGTRVNGKTQSDPNDPRTIADFVRREIGVEIGQPLFQGGRIFYSEKQARVQRDISELQIAKIRRETAYEIWKALYGYVLAKEALLIRRAAHGECKLIVDTTLKKKEIGIASESEYLGVLSASKQLHYKVISQEKDVQIAESRLLGALNLDGGLGELDIRLESAYSQNPVQKLELGSVMNLAMTNRADLKMAYLSRKYREYARKTARGDYLLKVDASAFVGQSGAAFQSESLQMKDSYNFGLKGVLYFGGSSFSPTATTEKTAPDLGSTSRTETESQSVTIGVLDSLGAASKVLEAKIEEEKAEDEYRKIKKDITLEVKEAFYNHEKAKLQIDSAKSELEYRKKEASIAQEKDRLHQIDATQYLQSLTSQAEAEIGLREAMSFYLISIAALEKATEVPLGRNQ